MQLRRPATTSSWSNTRGGQAQRGRNMQPVLFVFFVCFFFLGGGGYTSKLWIWRGVREKLELGTLHIIQHIPIYTLEEPPPLVTWYTWAEDVVAIMCSPRDYFTPT